MTTYAIRYREKARELYEAAHSASTAELRGQLATLARQYELLAASAEEFNSPVVPTPD
jgi:hypothetical protein